MFLEFDEAEREKWFKVTEKKVAHHIDTLYYSVSIKFDGTSTNDERIKSLISTLEELKNQKLVAPASDIEYMGLDVLPTSFSIYQYHLQAAEMYDIFIAKNIPNNITPRIVVQLRSRMLVLDGVSKSIDSTFEKVEKILKAHKLNADKVRENRIDYAYHTNIIQDSNSFFNDDYVAKHLKKSLGKINDVKNIRDGKMEYETMSIGQKKSNNIFVRMYNKTREVIEKKYKAFFFKIWLEKGLISEYDFYVLNKAFENGGFVTGILHGRIEWYLEFGKNETIKEELRELRTKYEIDADNAKFVEKRLAGLLPKVTMVTNIEFQTKREFYVSFDKSISSYDFIGDCVPALERLYKVLYLRREFLNYLTTKTICFVERSAINKRKYTMCDWWLRIHRCAITPAPDEDTINLVRNHDRVADEDRARRQYLRSTARLSMIMKNDLGYRTFEEDCADVLCSLNDNDFYGFNANPSTGEVITWDLQKYEYSQLQRKVVRQHRSIINDQGEHKMIRVTVLKANYVTKDKSGKDLQNPYCEVLFKFDNSTAEKHFVNPSIYERPSDIKQGQQYDLMFDRKDEKITYMELVDTQTP